MMVSIGDKGNSGEDLTGGYHDGKYFGMGWCAPGYNFPRSTCLLSNNHGYIRVLDPTSRLQRRLSQTKICMCQEKPTKI